MTKLWLGVSRSFNQNLWCFNIIESLLNCFSKVCSKCSQIFVKGVKKLVGFGEHTFSWFYNLHLQNSKADKNVSTRDEGMQMGGTQQKLVMVKLKKKKLKKKKDKCSQSKERKATKTLAIVLGNSYWLMFGKA